MPAVTFLPSGRRVECAAGESIFAVARRSQIAITTACVGKATCGLCRVKIVGGESLLSTLNVDERKHLGNVYFITKQRLSCQAQVLAEGEVTVEVPSGK
ncbi:MAG TPA: 2Fe-2S iron-sulfur cluster-binding protein [Polyangia bacterium]|jgi:2Fe-2S ferredoxin|nr:2Fe-2S iron-sulfur cluster-binding protein [Polyangia bacterium]